MEPTDEAEGADIGENEDDDVPAGAYADEEDGTNCCSSD
jgi:hypothetical protein